MKLIMESWRKFIDESGTYASSKYRDPAGAADPQDVNQMIKKYVRMNQQYESAYADGDFGEIQSFERALDALEAKIKELMPDFKGGGEAQNYLDQSVADVAKRAGGMGISRSQNRYGHGAAKYGALAEDTRE